MPIYDVSEYHETTVRAPVDKVYNALRTTDLGTSFLVRMLLILRALPNLFSAGRHSRESRINLETLMKNGFVLLGENPPNEILLGVIGRFWAAAGETRRVSNADEFRVFDQPGYAKAVWNFSLVEDRRAGTRLATETRVLCLDKGSRRRFGLYWSMIGPFSGLIRREVLRTIRNAAESPEFRIP